MNRNRCTRGTPCISRTVTDAVGRGFFLLCKCVSLCALVLALNGCGLLKGGGQSDPAESADTAAAKAQDADEWQGAPVPYAVRFVCDDKSLEKQMSAVSQLVSLKKEPPDSLLALERRARVDVDTAVKLLHSLCYYDGQADFQMDESASPVRVTLTLTPGVRYNLGSADVIYEPKPVIPKSFANRTRATGFWGFGAEPVPPPSFPESVPGVTLGKPVKAGDMLDAVNALPEKLHQQGYPLAAVTDARYTLEREAHLLHARIQIDPGPPSVMGPVTVRENKEVDAAYIQRLAPWQVGQEPWNADTVEDYANHLRTLGIFRTVTVKPLTEEARAQTTSDGIAVLPVAVTVAESPFRSVGGSARYDTDTGFGVEGFWEHRNLFGNGEKLTVTAPLATDVQGLKAAFEKPAFLVREQRLLATASALREDTIAYEKTAVSAAADVERRLSRYWWGSLGLGGEGGAIKDNERGTQDYGFGGPRAGLRRDARNNILNPTDGSDLWLKLTPYTGYYGESFTTLGGTLSASGYYAPLRDRDGPDDTLVLAGKVEVGSMMGAALRTLPASLRYYKGGAGSVRGYAYQSIGPRDKDDEPLGGRSFQTVNLEARYKLTEDVGLVPFLDGGMVYKDEVPQIVGNMRWGTGLGLRYYTPIGPLRLDVGFPLQPIAGDPPVQLYISIGQAF